MSMNWRLVTHSTVAAAVLAVTACSTDTSELAPCPATRVLAEPSELTRFRDGPGRDAVDVAFQAYFTRVTGSCEYGKDGGDISVQLNVLLDVRKGPSIGTEPAAFEYFVAVAEQDAGGEPRITSREAFPVAVAFTAARSGVTYGDDIELTIPRPDGAGVGRYQIYLGLVLTPAELAYNRSKSGQ